MKFRTILPVKEFGFNISHHDKIMSIGSCFAERISQKLSHSKFDVLKNPFGVIYNPISISRNLISLVENKIWNESDLRIEEERHFCFDFHGFLTATNKLEALSNIHSTTQKATRFLNDTTILIVTLGTSFVYYLKETGDPVANCHKVPQKCFDKILSGTKEIYDHLERAFEKLREFNNQVKIIVSVSPVRHLRDGMIENNRSKARLLEAVHTLSESHSYIHYFPSYELLLDDLRDYRFYAKDLVHPDDQAFDYIYEYFNDSFFDSQTKKLIKKIQIVKQGYDHRPLLRDSEAHQHFLIKLGQEIQQLVKEYPYLDFTKEIENLASRKQS